jgi:hypothetical protein
MEKLMTMLCFGDGDGTDSKAMCYVDQFLAGLNLFKGLFITSPPSEDTQQQPRASSDTQHSVTTSSTK